jgi:hypothetical protein
MTTVALSVVIAISRAYNTAMALTRRALIVASLAPLAGSAEAGSRKAVPSTTVRYIMPVPAGSRNGISWENAASLWQLNEMIAAAGPGGTVYVRADADSYQFNDNRIYINTGGQVGSPVTVMGVDRALAPMKATIIGTRTAWTLPADLEAVTNVKEWSPGRDIFLLRSGADYLTFRNFDFQRTGQPFRLTGAMHRGITISDCTAYNFTRFFEHDRGTTHVDTILRNITGTGFSKTAIRIRGDSHNVLLEDIALNSGRQDGHNFATGVECNDTAHGITMRRVAVANCHDTQNSNLDKFWNADGFASERGNYDIYREGCTSSGNTDAGYDDKATNVRLVNCTASGNKVNYKFWGPSHVNINCKAASPKSRGGTGGQMQYYVYGGHAPDVPGAAVHIQGGIISDNDPNTSVFVAERHNSVFRIAGVAINHHAKALVQTELGGWGNAFLHAPAPYTTTPKIASAASATAAVNINFSQLLKADRPVTWSIVGGPDAASFNILPNRRTGTLTMPASPGGANRQVIVRATDANGNNADQTITLAFGATADVFFRDSFNRADQDLVESADWRLAADDRREGKPGDFAVRNQKLAIFNTAYHGAAYASPDCGFADHYVQATVEHIPRYYNGMLACRLANLSNLIGVEFKNDRIALYELAMGRFQELGFISTPPMVRDVIRLEVKGVDATVKKNGIAIIGPKTTAVTNAAWTSCGLLARSLAVEPWIDNYEAGPL